MESFGPPNNVRCPKEMQINPKDNMELDNWPEMLTVEEAAAYLRISRTLGYQLARQYRTTDGAAGLPVVQLGRCLRVPRDQLALLVRGPCRESLLPPVIVKGIDRDSVS